jgi:hypothetical protein
MEQQKTNKTLIFQLNKTGNLNLDDLDDDKRVKEENANLINSVEFLINLKEPWKLLEKCEEAIICLETITEINLNNSFTFDLLINSERKYAFVELLVDYLKHVYELIKQNVEKHNRVLFYGSAKGDSSGYFTRAKKTDYFLNEFNKLYSLMQFALIMWNWTDKSNEFCFKLYDFKGMRVLFKYIKDYSLIMNLRENIDKYKGTKTSEEQVYLTLAYVYKCILGAIHNLTKLSSLFRSEWIHLKAVENLLKFDKYLGEISDFRLLIYFSLVNLVDEANRESMADKLNNSESIVRKVVDLIAACSKDLTTNSGYVERKTFKMNIESSSDQVIFSDEFTLEDIAVVSWKRTIWRLTELLKFVEQLCEVHDSKLDCFVYYECQLGEHLKSVIFNGNEIEKEAALKLLLKVCNKKQIALSIKQDINLYSLILGMSINQSINNRSLVRVCDLIIILINNMLFPNENLFVQVDYNVAI